MPSHGKNAAWKPPAPRENQAETWRTLNDAADVAAGTVTEPAKKVAEEESVRISRAKAWSLVRLRRQYDGCRAWAMQDGFSPGWENYLPKPYDPRDADN